MTQERRLRAVLIVIGIGFVAVYPMINLWQAGFRWEPSHPQYEQMIAGVYAVLGIFLVRASRDPFNHLSLIWFTVWSSLVHAILMAVHAVLDPSSRVHLIGDVPALATVVVILAVLTARKGNDMAARIRTVTFDCQRWEPLVEFWSQVGDFGEDPDNPNEPGDPEGLLVSASTGMALLFIPVPEPKSVKNRVHLDLEPVDSTRDEEVDRLLGLGATMNADHRREDGTGFVQLADPEGNEFCVERSVTERSG